MNQIKNKFDPNNEVSIQNYSTLDNDYRRNRPVRGNHSSLHQNMIKDKQSKNVQEPTP